MSRKNVMERAEEALDYWNKDSMWSRIIERDLEANDIEALDFHLNEADAQMEMQEDFANRFEDRLLSEEPFIDTSRWPIIVGPEGFRADV